MSSWTPIQDENAKYAIAICSFKHPNTHTLSFKIGERLRLVEENDEWYRGHLETNNKSNKIGIFPKNYVAKYDPKDLSHSDSAVIEIDSILREWTSVWFQKYEECEKRKITHSLMACFKNLLNLKNVIVGNRASIDEIKDYKKSTASKILQGNSLLGLDVIAYDLDYNRLDTSEATTIFLYEELKKNSHFKTQAPAPHSAPVNTLPLNDDSLFDENRKFLHQPSMSNSNSSLTRSSTTFCLKLSLESLLPSANCVYSDENSQLCVNLFLSKDISSNSIETNYYLCENAFFQMSLLSNSTLQEKDNSLDASSSGSPLSTSSLHIIPPNGRKYVIFCDISEKDFELTKSGYKLVLAAYAIKHSKGSPDDMHSSISQIFAGGVFDLGSALGNIAYVSADTRTIQSSMILALRDFEYSIVNSRIFTDLLNSREGNDTSKSSKNSQKEAYLKLNFKCELSEMNFKKVLDQYSHLYPPRICRKMDFPDIIMPDDFRNDFYVTVVGGEFQKQRNYEFVVNLVQFREENDRVIEFPVDFNEGSEEEQNHYAKKTFFYKSIAYPKLDKPKWNEIVNVSIPHGKKVEEIKRTYLRFLIRSRPADHRDKTKVIGRCYLQITNEDGSAIQDCRCILPMHKIENESDLVIGSDFIGIKTAPSLYKLASVQQNNPNMAAEKHKDFIDVKVKVVSTQLTQNVTLLNLLSFSTEVKPDADRYESLLTYLDELLVVKDEQSAEIVKFLQAILDKLIDILLDLKTKHTRDASSISERTYEIHSKKIQLRVFDILVAIFQIIENQSKFASFRTVIDAYLSKNFCITLAHRPLLRIFCESLNNIHAKYSAPPPVAPPSPAVSTQTSTSSIRLPPSMSNGAGQQHRNINSLSFSGGLQIANELNSGRYDAKDNDNAINTIKSMEYIFKFAFRSRELLSLCSRSNTAQSGDAKVDPFDNDVANIFKKLIQIATLRPASAASTSTSADPAVATDWQANLTKVQSFILKYSITLMPILIESNRYTYQKISELYIGFLQSRYVLQTQFLSKLIKSKLFEKPESRRIIIGPLCKALTDLLTVDNNNEEKVKIDSKLESIGKVFAELMDVFERKNIGATSQDMNEMCTMLFQLIKTYLYLRNQSASRQLYASILISMMRTMDASHFETFFNSSIPLMASSIRNSLSTSYSIIDSTFNELIITNITSDDQLAHSALVKLMLHICQSLIDADTFPKDWFDLLILRNNVVMNALYHIAERINKFHLEEFNKLNEQIWRDYFHCMVQLCTDRCLQLEKFNENKRKNALLRFKDIRVKAAGEIKKMWYNLGDKKLHFIPSMVDPFLKVALIPINDIHNAIIPLFFDMINSEYYNLVTRNATHLEFEKFAVPHQLITTIDYQVTQFGAGDMQFRNSFEKIFKEKFGAHINLRAHIDFVSKFVDLFDLLVEYRDMLHDSSDELKTFYLNELLHFYQNLGRYDLYLKYLKLLREIHKNMKNQVCAAHVLKLHAESLNWSNEPVEPYLMHPSYPKLKVHRVLKEKLFVEIINNFTEGQAWEKAFEFAKILRERYESQYELDKLSKLLRDQADLCESVIRKDRLECNYFLVGFYGRGFPRLLQNKQFVFKSEQLEQIITFRPRVESWFPKAQRISHSNPITDLNSDTQFIQVISVQPIYEANERFKDLSISPKLLKYYQHNEVNKFKYTFRKETKLNEDDPTLWWIRERVVTTSNPLPKVINFYPVVTEVSVDISPIQNAINTVRERHDKLKMFLDEIRARQIVDEQSKSLIQGTVDPGVNGGLPKYRKFYSASYAEANKDSQEKVDELKELVLRTIKLAEEFLVEALTYLPNDDLLSILEKEQLPKLKSLFDLPIQPTMRRRNLITNGSNHSFQQPQQMPYANGSHVDPTATPKTSSKQSSNDQEYTPSTKSFLKQLSSSENHAGRSIFSYLSSATEKAANFSLQQSTNSHRSSITSLKSNASDDEFTRNKIVLDEIVNPKRPLRPNRLTAQNSTSSPSNSNQSSRPISRISGDEINSMHQSNNTNSNQGSLSYSKNGIDESLYLHEELNDSSSDAHNNSSQLMKPPPPKPPKPANLFMKLNIGGNISLPTSSSSRGNNGVVDSSSGPVRFPAENGKSNGSGKNHNNNGVSSKGSKDDKYVTNSNSHSRLNSVNSQSTENIKKQIEFEQTQSTLSLNNLLQFKNLKTKTSSDTVLNRV